MAARSGAGLASVITAVTLAISGSSGATVVNGGATVVSGGATVVSGGATVVSGEGAIGSGSAESVQIITCVGCPPAADGHPQAPQIIDVLDDLFAGMPGLPGRLVLTIPGRFGSRLLLMHF